MTSLNQFLADSSKKRKKKNVGNLHHKSGENAKPRFNGVKRVQNDSICLSISNF
jgi:hypothetical protein